MLVSGFQKGESRYDINSIESLITYKILLKIPTNNFNKERFYKF